MGKIGYASFQQFLDNVIMQIQGKIAQQRWSGTLNAGGCGFFALYVSECLNKYGIEAQIVRLEHHSDEKQSWKQFFKNPEENAHELSAPHFVVQVKDTAFDSRGVSRRTQLETNCIVDTLGCPFIHVGFMTSQEMKIALEVGRWNARWNREYNDSLKECIENVIDDFMTYNKIPS